MRDAATKTRRGFAWVSSAGDALSLSLTLSRWAREQPLATNDSRKSFEQQAAPISPKRAEHFSLSQRERAGVRENGWNTPSVHAF
jgi:hypothetical protein